MAVQNANAVAITGGTITNTTVTGTGLPTGCAQLPCVVAHVPITSYTAPIAAYGITLLTVPTSPSAGTNYCISSTITTTTAGSGAGTLVSQIVYYTPNGTLKIPSIGGPISLASAGSANTDPGVGTNVCFAAQAGSSINYFTSFLSGSTTGYAYQGSWQLTLMGP
jgi:hypothetical protein